MPSDLYAHLIATILAQLEIADPTSWSPPWHGADPLPVNARTGRRHCGLDTLLLWATAQTRGYVDRRWASYRQWAALGAPVQRGEPASPVLFYRDLPARAGEGGGPRAGVADERYTQFIAHRAHVSNATQVEGVPVQEIPGAAPVETDPNPVRAARVCATGVVIEPGGGRAAYAPAVDPIRRSARAVSRSDATYAATLTHELVPWTGAQQRLTRDRTGRFGSPAYAAEELVAEIGAAFVLADLSLARAPHPDHAASRARWLRLLHTESRSLATAASRAARAATDLGAFQGEASTIVVYRETAA